MDQEISPNGSNGLMNTSSVKSTMMYESKMKLKPTTAGTTAYRNHLSCWRSSPHARCSRTKSEKSAARMLVSNSVSPTTAEPINNSSGVNPPTSPTTANGFQT